jgi:hypothetical protein
MRFAVYFVVGKIESQQFFAAIGAQLHEGKNSTLSLTTINWRL